MASAIRPCFIYWLTVVFYLLLPGPVLADFDLSLLNENMSDSTAPQLASYKRIVICCDGTWLASDQGNDTPPSNVAKMARAIAPNGLDGEGKLVKQIVSYHSGLGSGDLATQKALYGGLGWGLDHDVTEIYDFIANNYEPNDQLFFFGYSRGAFTVRSAAALVSNVGILSAVDMGRFNEMWAAWRARDNKKPFQQSAWYVDNKDRPKLKNVQVKVVGVWDTVGALGVPRWPVVSWLQKFNIGLNRKYEFHDTSVSSNIDYAFQALALDEKRLTFPPTLWHKVDGGPAIDLQQCWFPGVHSNIGGQAEEPLKDTDRGQIGANTFAWMVDNFSDMLTFEGAAIDHLVAEHANALEQNGIPDGWGCGKIVDNFSGLIGKFFWALGTAVRTTGQYRKDAGSGKAGATNEFMHPMVRTRKQRLKEWNPPSLNGWDYKQRVPGQAMQWSKSGAEIIPEYTMRDKAMTVALDSTDGQPRFGTRDSLGRSLCPSRILSNLDRLTAAEEKPRLDGHDEL